VIRLNNVTFSYKKGTPVISELSLRIKKGERVHLLGESGSGKTTVLRLIMGLEKPQKGSVELADGAKLSAVFQENRLIPTLSALENVALFSDEGTAREVLTRLGLGEELDAMPDELSGGMKRRVALARALARKSDILILDEAMTGLDDANRERVAAVINEYAADRTLVCVTHDQREAELLNTKDVTIV
jgi:ABC-type nitrate/sulfonate/bicarbonate transport system ATPase subunit